ncbi:MAG: hypothetical protein GX043_02415 [Desulfovibrionales bacterium]|nr:hypothetical protein [Desulfovibrionales bacterium]
MALPLCWTTMGMYAGIMSCRPEKVPLSRSFKKRVALALCQESSFYLKA